MKNLNIYEKVAKWVREQPVEVLLERNYLYLTLDTRKIVAYRGRMYDKNLIAVCTLINGVALVWGYYIQWVQWY